MVLLVCDDRKSAKLQNIRPVICISLNTRSAYCVMSRCLKRLDTCMKWLDIMKLEVLFLVVRNYSL